MAKVRLKYFDRIRELLEADRTRPPAPLPPFDFDSLGSKSALSRGLTRFLLRRVLPATAFLLRQVCPNPRFGRVVLVTRAPDVERVLGDMAHFRVVYGEEMRDLGGGLDNVLSADGARHDALRALLEKCLSATDIAAVSDHVARDAEALIAAGAGRIDVMRDLISRTASEAACRLFGLTAHDPDLFGQWTMAVSTQLFGDFTGDANIHRQAKIASAHLAGMIDDAVTRIRRNNADHPDSKRERATVIDRMVTDLNVDADQVRATIIGLVTAFVPPNTLAAGNMLEALFDKPALLRAAREAAQQGDARAMRAVLLEAGRLNPALSPGLWRHVLSGAEPGAIGEGWGRRMLRTGDVILACIPSALRDGRGLTDERSRQRRQWMMFGSGPHDCWGAELALAHLVPVFIALLRQPGLRHAPGKQGRMLRIGAFPVHMDMIYDAPGAKRAMIVACFPVRPDVPRGDVEKALDALGNPARPDVAATLTDGDRVQFASLSVIEREADSPESILLLEVSGDGDECDLLDLIARQGLDWLAPILSLCRPGNDPVTDAAALARMLRQGHVPLDQRPFGNTGLHFDGLSELSVADIARQEKLANFTRRIIDKRLTYSLGLNTRAMGLLLHTRRLIRGDALLRLRRENRELQEQAKALELDGALLRPGRKRLAMADWQQPSSLWPGFRTLLLARENRAIPLTALALWTGWVAALLLWWAPGLSGAAAWAMGAVTAVAAALPLAILSLLLPLGMLAWLLRRAEKRDPVDERAAPLDHVAAIARREDAPGHAQNHIIAVMPFKSGAIRKLSFAFAMWGIRQAVTYFFRPGFVVTMGTIHKARWFRVPGTSQFVFFSNYDGSWESYLEDFITRAHEGQSAAWSHGVGFPSTRFLILDGAADGDRFKRWVRLQQRETRFWFSRFPNLTAQQIRNNAMIEDGLARAVSDTDARRWLSNFGSAQRERDELESEEVQSILFSGLPHLAEATTLFLRLPESRDKAGLWISAISGLRPAIGEALVGPPARWVRQGENGSHISLPQEARLLFGDRSWRQGGAMLGLTARGLRRLGLDEQGGLSAMPAVFRMTMSDRARLLGDRADAPAGWQFSDQADRDNEAHAMLTLYGHEAELSHDDLVTGHQMLLAHFGGDIVHPVRSALATPHGGGAPSLHYEPFGFRDGISQPAMHGTRRAARPVPDRDKVAAGEFLLGYKNQQGHLSPSITVGAERDPACELPAVSAATANRYPWYGNRGGTAEPRDFGRNGSFLAVRKFEQNVESFWAQAEDVCKTLRRTYPELSDLAGCDISAEWVAARMIGRWPNGTPLVGHRDQPAPSGSDATTENDFTYGTDDPRGLACPLGSHMRRTNPRDSQEPGDADEQQITNRHRLLRRGRAYREAAEKEGETDRQGLLFMAFCSDLERQFEFVQRTWINATSFHGLVDERDPLMGRTLPGGSAAQGESGGFFTFPTAAGPVRVSGLRSHIETRGGGYFFVPSRSALAYLVTQSQR